jgi:TPR repeat protein
MKEMNKLTENREMFLQQAVAACEAGDYTKAAEWLRKAAAQGHAAANDFLAKLEATALRTTTTMGTM